MTRRSNNGIDRSAMRILNVPSVSLARPMIPTVSLSAGLSERDSFLGEA